MSKGEYRTPASVFKPLWQEFHFNVDAAATVDNTFAERFYTAETDGTRREHYGYGDRVWCNPPYQSSTVAKFVETAALTSRHQGALWVLLLNATTTDTRWFHQYVYDRRLWRPREGVELRLLKGRIAFLDEAGQPTSAPRYSNMVVIFYPNE